LKELKAVEQKIKEYNAKYAKRMEELELQESLTNKETKELQIRKSNLSRQGEMVRATPKGTRYCTSRLTNCRG
jgi:hypothetical protein